MNGGVLVTLYKDYLNEEQLKNLGLNKRKIKAVEFVKANGKITNKEYQNLNNVSERTALRDFDELINKSILNKQGEKKGTYMSSADKWRKWRKYTLVSNGSIGS